MALTFTNGMTMDNNMDAESATNWGSNPTNVSVKAYVNNGDVTSTVFPSNSPSVAGDVISLSPLKNLTVSVIYKMEVQFTSGGNVFQCYFNVEAG